MDNPRLKLLLEFYEEDPADPFNVYALALEYLKADAGKARAYFEQLLLHHPDYLPAYYHAAALLAELGQVAYAEEVYQKGLQLALDQHNTKTYQELQRAYRAFQDENEEW